MGTTLESSPEVGGGSLGYERSPHVSKLEPKEGVGPTPSEPCPAWAMSAGGAREVPRQPVCAHRASVFSPHGGWPASHVL